jgi:hypothetical protein
MTTKNSDEIRIRLAELRGWGRRPLELLEPFANGEPRFGPQLWDCLDGSIFGVSFDRLPDPMRNPTDWLALVSMLNEAGHNVGVTWWDKRSSVRCSVNVRGQVYSEHRTDAGWMVGVTRLAYGVLGP